MWALARQQKDREAFAREHLAALEKRQSFLLVDRPDTPPAGLEVRLDGRVLPPTRWGVPSAVDPGMHTLVATAPYKEAQPLVFFVEEGPATRFVRIPALLDAPPINVPATEAARPPRDPAPTSSDTAATVAFATGGVALTVAVACAVRAAIAAADACPGGVCNDSSAGDAATARDFAVAAVASTGAALLAAGAGAWLLLEKPAALTARRGAPSWGVGGVPGGAALRVGGVF